MTQRYYADKILPKYLDQINNQKRRGRIAILQEDDDPSHGTQSKTNIVLDFEKEHGMECLTHPAQSPDIKPIEGVWNISKQRFKRRYLYGSIEDLKKIIQEEWKCIDQSEVQARIQEMPWRCRRLTKNGGNRIRTSLW